MRFSGLESLEDLSASRSRSGILTPRMELPFNLFLVLFAGVWLFLAWRGICRALKSAEQTKWLIVVSGFLVLIGSAGFFAEAMSGVGIINLPRSYEWPAGYASGVKKIASGLYVVPLDAEGRVQLYDSNWHFLRGWNVEAQGGDFTVAPTPDGNIDVFTSRGEHQYSFTENGDLLSTANFSDSSWSPQKDGQTVIVPTSPVLWAFSSPAISWGIAILGLIGLGLVKKFTGQKLESSKPPMSR